MALIFIVQCHNCLNQEIFPKYKGNFQSAFGRHALCYQTCLLHAQLRHDIATADGLSCDMANLF